MAQNTDITCPAGQWTLLTDANVDALRAVNRGRYGVSLMATVGTTPPNSQLGALPLLPGVTLAADLTLADLFPGIPGANRVYAFASEPTVISVSHA